MTNALNILYTKKGKIYPPDVSKETSNREKKVIILMTPNGKKWHYLAVKKQQHY